MLDREASQDRTIAAHTGLAVGPAPRWRSEQAAEAQRRWADEYVDE
jgi:hypothetical protein